MRALITGATGLVGSALVPRLDAPWVVSRRPDEARRQLGVTAFGWDAAREELPPEALRDVDVVFNLAGEPVAEGRWSDDKKRRIRDSRVEGTRRLVAAMARAATRPRVLISASAVGYYGDRGDEELDEGAAPGADFLSQVCVDWEQEALAAGALGVRVVCARLGIVLAPRGGALARMLPPFRLGLGGRVASGRQWMPWIHLDDVVGLLLHAASDARLRGPLNVVSPAPVTNADFTRALAHAVHRPAFMPIPRLALRLAFGELADVLVASQRALPRAAQSASHVFRYPELAPALAAAL